MTVTSNASLIDTTVWLVFVYLGYRVLTIVLATRRRRCQLHAAIRSWKDLLGLDLPVMFARMQQKLLTTRESNPSPSFESPGTRVASTESLSPYSECGEDNVFSLAERMLDHELNGRVSPVYNKPIPLQSASARSCLMRLHQAAHGGRRINHAAC